MTGSVTAAEAAQGGVRLRLTLTGDACAAGWRATRFTLDGATLPAHADAAANCRFVSDPVTEGRHRLAGGADAPQDIDIVRDLIVSLGDSVASGEGNPDRRADLGKAHWQDRRCHRSLRRARHWRRWPSSAVGHFLGGAAGARLLGRHDAGRLKRPTAGSSRAATTPPRPPQLDVLNDLAAPAGRRRGAAQRRRQRRVLLEHHRVLRALHRLPASALRPAPPASGGAGLGADARRRDRRRAARGSPPATTGSTARSPRGSRAGGSSSLSTSIRRSAPAGRSRHPSGARHDRRPRGAVGAHPRGRRAERR